MIVLTNFNSLLQVNDKIQSLNGQLISTMTNKEIHKCLIKPNAVIVVIPSDAERRNKLCLKANGISVMKDLLKKTIVKESINPNIVIGSVILFINGIHLDNVNIVQISEALLYPNCKIEYEVDVIRQCLEANLIYATRLHYNSKTTVTHSSRSDIPIGTVLVNIDSHYVHELCNERIIKLLLQPNRIIQYSKKDDAINDAINDVVINDDGINDDAKQYGKQYDSFTQFDVCGVCAAEYGPIHLKPITEHDNLISSSKIDVFYNNILQTLSNNDSTSYDKRYANALKAELTSRGILATAKFICTFCIKQMKRNNKRQHNNVNDDEPTSSSQVNSSFAIPKEAIINGLFAGAIPDELQNLTDIEKSMISIYSPVTKYSLCTKEHYRINGATTYTIVNDLFTIANQLPKKIDPSTVGILQTKSRKLNSNFTFRPLIVKNALTWLKINNHLYKSIHLHWYEDNFDWDSLSEVNIPLIKHKMYFAIHKINCTIIITNTHLYINITV